MKTLDKFSNGLNKVVTVIASAAFVVLVISTLIQVCCRYFLKVSVPWTEELARFCFIWSTMLGASVLVKAKGHPAVDALTGKLRGRSKSIQELLVALIVLAMSVVCIKSGITLVGSTMYQTSPAMGVPYAYIYLSFPVGCGLICLHLIVEAADCIAAIARGDAEKGGRN